jgi:hypothetical protein
MIDPPSDEPRNEIEAAADAALEAFRAALPPGRSPDDEGGHLILLARVPGLRPDAVAGGASDPVELLDLLLHHARAVAVSLGLPFEIVEVGQG